MAVRSSQVPSLDPELRTLFLYLQRRDIGSPNPRALSVAELEQTTVSGDTLDRLRWEYVAPPESGPARQDPDGFIVWWEDADTTDPLDGGVRVSADARQFSMLWPTGTVRSYAVAAFRNTHQGEQATPKLQHESWHGVT